MMIRNGKDMRKENSPVTQMQIEHDIISGIFQQCRAVYVQEKYSDCFVGIQAVLQCMWKNSNCRQSSCCEKAVCWQNDWKLLNLNEKEKKSIPIKCIA